MENIEILASALEFIEQNLTEPIKTEDIAASIYCSKSTIEKLFRYFNDISIRDYIIRRRMSNAAKDMVQNQERSLLEIAMQYGYSSNEAFTRAFQSVWHVSPSEYRKNPSHFALFPGFRMEPEIMEDKSMDGRKKVDISELYDCIKERRGCYMVLGDIKSLVPINNISRELGDVAIITALSRMEEAAGPEDIVFRVGGDEFVILTDSKDEKYAVGICEQILSHNGETITCNGQSTSLSLYAKPMKLEEKGNIRYAELFAKIQGELNAEFKRAQDVNN